MMRGFWMLISFTCFCIWNTPAVAMAVDSEKLKQVIESQSHCENFIRADEQNVYLGFGIYRKFVEEPRSPIPAYFKIIPLDHPEYAYALDTADAAIDMTRQGNTLFLLTYSGIEEWDLGTRTMKEIYPTYQMTGAMAYEQHPQGFARYNDKMIIAHGRLGVSFFDLKSKRLTNQFHLAQNQGRLESESTAVTVLGKYAYVLMDSFSLVPNGQKQPFRGLIVIDMETEKVISEMEGMDTGTDAMVNDGHKLIVSFRGYPLWKYDMNHLQGNKMPEPELRFWQFPVAGHPTGKPMMDSKYYFTCYLKDPPQPGGNYTRVPMALDRHALHLD